jgi:hypothetical protein
MTDTEDTAWLLPCEGVFDTEPVKPPAVRVEGGLPKP